MEGWKGRRVDFQKRAQVEMSMMYVDRSIFRFTRARFVFFKPQTNFCGCAQKIDGYIQTFVLILKIKKWGQVASKVIT